MTIKLATINIEVSDLERTKAFYKEVFGMVEDLQRSHPPTFAYLASPGCAITMTIPNETAKPDASRTMEMGFETDDLATLRERLKNRGHQGAVDKSMGWADAVELRDPDGYRIVVYQFGRR